ncbi:MAG TPA: efflux RND transporter periplasmic adaptor subunit [Kofleriaceae bacterium]|nr:efflux RND transporter periplasmic adaptor subunit [Kofleriaceae bacterium]
MTITRWIFAGVVIALVGLVTVSSLRPRPIPPVTVHTATAARHAITRTVSGAGKLEPARKINVSSNITGTLLDLRVAIGSKVDKGQVLAQIDTSRYRAQVEQQAAQVKAAEADAQRARANVAYLKAEEQRASGLVKGQVISEQELAQAKSTRELAEAEASAAESRAKMAQAALQEANSALGWATITAPVAGTVLSLGHRVGERVRGSDFDEDVILVLGSVGEVDVRLEVGEHDVVFIQPGQRATVEIDAFGDQTFPGRVIDAGRDAIVRNAGTENEVTSFPVWVALDEVPERALSGMSAQVTIETDTHANAVVVPIQAVTVRSADAGATGSGGGAATGSGSAAAATAVKRKLDKVVFVVDHGKVSKRVVDVGLSSESEVEILHGVQPGDVVVEGPYRTLARDLTDGAPVTVAAGNGS